MHRYELSDEQWARIEPLLPHRTHHGKLGHPFNDHRPSSTASSGSFTPAPPGATSPNAMAPGRPCTTGSIAGVATARGVGSSPRSWMNWTIEARSIMTCGASTVP